MIYFLKMSGSAYIKIGYTSRASVTNRLLELQTSCPRKLEVIATIEGDEKTEAEYHRRFYQFKTDGGQEWFDLPSEIIKELENLDNGQAENNQRAVGGASAFDVRPVRWRQSNKVASIGKDVPNSRRAFDNSRD